MQVDLRVYEPVMRPHVHELVFLIEDVEGCDPVRVLVPRKRWDFDFTHIGLGLARGLSKLHLRVLHIGLVGLGE